MGGAVAHDMDWLEEPHIVIYDVSLAGFPHVSPCFPEICRNTHWILGAERQLSILVNRVFFAVLHLDGKLAVPQKASWICLNLHRKYRGLWWLFVSQREIPNSDPFRAHLGNLWGISLHRNSIFHIPWLFHVGFEPFRSSRFTWVGRLDCWLLLHPTSRMMPSPTRIHRANVISNHI